MITVAMNRPCRLYSLCFYCRIHLFKYLSFNSIDSQDSTSVRPKSKKKFSCQFCSKAFSRTFDLEQHVRSHTGLTSCRLSYTMSDCVDEFMLLYRGETISMYSMWKSFLAEVQCQKAHGHSQGLA